MRRPCRSLAGSDDYDGLLDLIGDARIVLIGEASHGTHEFYSERARITRRLIAERGFNAVAVEADWPDAYRINRYVRGESDDPDALAALGDFQRFPRWMWRNEDVLEFVAWLREYNDALPAGAPQVGFYGLDLYSLRASIAGGDRLSGQGRSRGRRPRARAATPASIISVTTRRPMAMRRRSAWPNHVRTKRSGSCVEMQRRAAELRQPRRPRGRGRVLLRRAERPPGQERRRVLPRHVLWPHPSWNLRDGHMAETLTALVAHLNANASRPRSWSGRTTPTSAMPGRPRWWPRAS